MDINDIFKPVETGPGKGKRKSQAPSLETLKRGKYGVLNIKDDSVRTGDHGVPNGPSVEDVLEGDDAIESVPGTRDLNGEVDDEGGRFYGDGLTSKEKSVLDWVDEAENIETVDATTIKKLILRLEKCVSKNTELRIKHPDDPTKFVESEADLDEAIQQLMQMGSDVAMAIPIFISLEAAPTLTSLLNHENMDIVLDVVQVIGELTAEDMWSTEEKSESEQKAIMQFLDALIANSLFDFLGEALRKLNEAADGDVGESDREGVHSILTLVENIVTLNAAYAVPLVTGMRLLPWLLERIQAPRLSPSEFRAARASSPSSVEYRVDTNQQYSAEILSILLQSENKLHRPLVDTKPKYIPKDTDTLSGVDVLLQCLAWYRRKDPQDSQEEEYMESLFGSLCSLLCGKVPKRAFVEAEGVELIVRMIRERRLARPRAFKVLSYALTPIELVADDPSDDGGGGESGSIEAEISERFINGQGLDPLFAAFMKKGARELSKWFKGYSESEEEEHVVSCLSLLFQFTDPGTPLRWRILSKFVDLDSANAKEGTTKAARPSKGRARLDRLLELHAQLKDRVDTVDEQIELLPEEVQPWLDSEERYFERLNAGLSTLQMVDVCIANILLEDREAEEHIRRVLTRRGQPMDTVRSILRDFVMTLLAESEQPRASDGSDSEAGARIPASARRRIDNLQLAIAAL